MQLQSKVDGYKQAGIGVVALTYDSPELQQAFLKKFAITYPLASDVDAASVKALGVLNNEYKPGDSGYGVPYPGVFVVNADQKIVGKIFLKGYTTRVNAEGVLAYATKVLQ